jgi:hypothetical protein
VSSSLAWLRPPVDEVNIIVVGTCRAISAGARGLPSRLDQALVEGDGLDGEDAGLLERAVVGGRGLAGGAAGLGQHLGQVLGLGVAQVDHELGFPGNGGGDVGLLAQDAGRAHAAVAPGDLLDGQRGGGGGQAGVAAQVHRCGAGVGGLAGEAEAVALVADRPAHRGDGDALGLQHRALLDVELQVGAQPLAASLRLADAVEVDAVLGDHLAQHAAVRVAQLARRRGVQGARHGRASEQAAPEARALLVGEVDQGHAVRGAAQHLQRGHHAQRAVEPPAAGDGVDVRAHHGRAPRWAVAPARPQIRRRVDFDGDAVDLGQPRAQEVARLGPHWRPAHAPGAVRPAGEPVQLAKVGEDAPGVGLHQPTRSRRSACIRQWAPPPPAVKVESSGS